MSVWLGAGDPRRGFPVWQPSRAQGPRKWQLGPGQETCLCAHLAWAASLPPSALCRVCTLDLDESILMQLTQWGGGWERGCASSYSQSWLPGPSARDPPHFRQPFWPQKRGKKEVLDLELLWILGCSRDQGPFMELHFSCLLLPKASSRLFPSPDRFSSSKRPLSMSPGSLNCLSQHGNVAGTIYSSFPFPSVAAPLNHADLHRLAINSASAPLVRRGSPHRSTTVAAMHPSQAR